MTTIHRITPLLATSLALLLLVPAAAQDGEGGGSAPSESAPEEMAPAPPSAMLPTAPSPIANPDQDLGPDFARPAVAIIPFIETYSADGIIVATGGIGDILATEMSKSGRFSIIAKKEQLKELIQNAQIEQGGGLYDMETVADLGHFRGADYLFQGRITGARLKSKNTEILGFGGGSESATIRIDFGLYSAETGELVFSSEGEGTSKTTNFSAGGYGGMTSGGTSAGMFDGAISKACENIVQKIVDTDLFPVRANIMGTAGGGAKVVIDLGKAAGLYEGISLDIREVESLVDDTTGEVLFHELGNIIGTLVLDQCQVERSVGHVSRGTDAKKGFVVEVPRGTDLRKPETEGEGSTDDRYADRGEIDERLGEENEDEEE